MTNSVRSPRVAIVVAVAENGVIGRDGTLPWRIPSDLKAFRRLTMGKPLVMGRRTFESLGKPLDGRDNIVLTRDPRFAAPGTLVVHSLDQAIETARHSANARGVDEIIVIGGAEVFKAAEDLADRLYMTRVHAEVEGETSYCKPAGAWSITSESERFRAPSDEHAWSLQTFDRVRT